MLVLLLLAETSTLVATPPQSIGDVGAWVTADDYPAAALREAMEGVTGMVLEISAAGRVTGCTVTESSGSRLLDDTACNLLTMRGQFRPARDGRKRPVAATWHQRVRWQLPDNAGHVDSPTPEPYAFIVDYVVGEDGYVESCAVRWQSGAAAGHDFCVSIRAVHFAPFRDLAGKAVRRAAVFRSSLAVEDPPASPPSPPPAAPRPAPSSVPQPG